MADYVWPDDLVPYAVSFYIQPHTGGSESPFNRQTKIYELSAPRWVCSMVLRAPESADRWEGTYSTWGERIDAFVAELGRVNRVQLWDFRRPGRAPLFSNAAAAAGTNTITLTGASASEIRIGEYIGGDGRPHIITDLVVSGSDLIATARPYFYRDIAAGAATFENVSGYFRLVSDDAGENSSMMGELTEYRLDFVEDWNVPVLLSIPTGFDWTPPVNVYTLGNSYTTDFKVSDWQVPATASLYVSTTGNNTTGDGTEGNPWRTIGKALDEAGLLADTDTNIFVETGEYSNPQGFGLFPDKNINIMATGGRVLWTNKVPITGASWTLDGTGTYRAPLAGWNANHGVRDFAFPVTWPNGAQTPQRLVLAANLAACQATPSTYFVDGTDIVVHLQDGRVPDADTGEDVGVMHGTTNNVIITHTGSLNYIEGFDFEGATAGAQGDSGQSIGRVVFNDCTNRLTVDNAPGFSFIGVALGIINNCRAYDVGADAFSYTAASGAPTDPSTFAVEIDCHAYQVGRSGTTHNGSTNHAAGRTVRVNGVYRDTLGPLCMDVNTCQAWCINVDAQDSLMTSNDIWDSCFVAGNAAESVEMWLDNCTTGGSFHDFYASSGSTIYYRNMVLPGSVGGTGTVTPY